MFRKDMSVSVFRVTQQSVYILCSFSELLEPERLAAHRVLDGGGASSRCAKGEWRVGNTAFVIIGG
jgi:hypothetical protein